MHCLTQTSSFTEKVLREHPKTLGYFSNGLIVAIIESASIRSPLKKSRKNPNKNTVNTFLTKLDSYEQIEIPSPLEESVEKLSSEMDLNENDKNDSLLLNEVCSGRVDIFITNPSLINYKVLNVKQVKFGTLSLDDPFFDSLKNDYDGFDCT